MSLEDYLTHETRSGSRSNFLKSWKNGKAEHSKKLFKGDIGLGDASIRVFLHTRVPIAAVWQHGLPRLQEVTRDNIARVEAWGGSWNCIEPDEEILKSQYFRDDETDERTKPPVICPMCLLIEWVRRAVRNDEIGFCDPIFKWEGDDPSKARIIHAAGIFNGFSSDKLTKSQSFAMSKSGISKKEAWAENSYAKCNYVYVIVDADNVGEGLKIAVETTLLGDKMKKEIRKRMTSEGVDDGNPLKNPVCFLWHYDDKAKLIQDKYDATALTRVPVTDEIKKLIIDTDPPTKSVTKLTDPGDIAELRAELEEHALIDTIPWDEIFGPAEKVFESSKKSTKNEKEDESDEEEDEAPESEKKPTKKTTAKKEEKSSPKEEKKSDDEIEVFACDVCKGDIRADEAECSHCGSKYNLKTGELIFNAKKAKEDKPKTTRSKAAGAKKKVDEDDEEHGPKSDDIPF